MCPHCIKFLEIFEELAETYSQNAGSEPTQIRFAKMNLDANERVPGRFIHNFPTIEVRELSKCIDMCRVQMTNNRDIFFVI
jgi:thiol-disulfide isomerase/thioredoxin